MANPTVQIHATDGSNTEASGAGPTTAIYGTLARVTAATTHIGLFEASAVDVSEVATDGTHVLWLGAGSGRRFSAISGKKSTRQAITGTIDLGDPDSLVVADSSGISASDPIRVAGAGAAAADLYTYAESIPDGTHVQLYDDASTAVTDAAVLCPEALTVSSAFTSSASDLAWAVGGKRQTIAGSTYLGADGTDWTMDVTGDQSYAGAVLVSTRQTWRGVSRPLIVNSEGDAEVFRVTADGCRFEGLQAGVGPKFISAYSAAVKSLHLDDILGQDCGHLLEISAAVTSGAFSLHLCGVTSPTTGAQPGSLVNCLGAARSVDLDFCEIWDVGVGLANGVTVTGATAVRCWSCVFDTVVIAVDLGSSSDPSASSSVTGCVFREIVNKGINAGHVERCRGLRIEGNTIEAQTYQIDLPSGGEAVASRIKRNSYVTAARLNNVTLDADSEVIAKPDVGLRDEAARDYRLGLSMRGRGGPAALPYGTPIAIDRGIQRREPLGGATLGEVISATALDPSTLEVQLYKPTGSSSGEYQAVQVPIVGAVPESDTLEATYGREVLL